MILGCTMILKGIIGLIFHDRFYSWDFRQYNSVKWPRSFIVFVPYGISMVALTWYATIFHYERHGYILTVLVAAMAFKIFLIIFRWHRFSNAMKKMIKRNFKKLYIIDIIIIPAGVFFILMAIYVY